MPQTTLTRDDIIGGLRDLIRELRAAGHHAQLQIIGGAAIALTVNADRHSTRDVDGRITPPEAVRTAAGAVADTRGWPGDWLNDEAAQFLPNGFGRALEWVTIYEDEHVCIQVATAEMLLAMKLHAGQRRLAREAEDLAVLLDATGIKSSEAAENLYGHFYPGDEFNPRLSQLVDDILASTFQPKPLPPPPAFT